MPRPVANHVYAVLTGDVIASSGMEATKLAEVRAGLHAAAQRFCNDYQASVEARLDQDPGLDIYRGDGWQLLLTEQSLALRLAAFMQANLHARADAGTRIAIGLGSAEFLDRDKVSLSTGEAFTLSGRALEAMSNHFDLAVALPDRAGPVRDWVQASVQACSQIVRSWTRRQAEIAALALLYPNKKQEYLAGMLDPPVSQQAIADALQSAGWRGLLAIVEAFEATDWTSLLGAEREE